VFEATRCRNLTATIPLLGMASGLISRRKGE